MSGSEARLSRREGAAGAVRCTPFAALLVLTALAGCGCGTAGERPLRIATSLPAAECDALAKAAASWVDPWGMTHSPPIRIVWLRAAPGVDPARFVEHGAAVDLLLGASLAALDRLAAADRLEAVAVEPDEDPPAPAPDWWVLDRPEVLLAADREAFDARAMPLPGGTGELDDPRLAGLIALDDPRRDSTTRALAGTRLAERGLATGYAELVGAAGNALPIGRKPGSAPALLGRGAVALAPVAGPWPPTDLAGSGLPASRFEPLSTGARPRLGVGVVAGARNPDAARRFLRFLKARAADDLRAPQEGEAAADGLRADWLGATLVDAQPELIEARRVLAAASLRSERLRAFLVEPPPWPPASIRELNRADASGALVQELASRLAPDLETRAWLLAHWEEKAPGAPPAAVPLEELAAAVGGRLAREPRFRAWLRAEWTAWARQRYRRVARQARADAANRSETPAPPGPAPAEPGPGEPT